MAKLLLNWIPTNQSDRRFVILRHAEKTGLAGDPHLSVQGHMRANALTTLPQIVGNIDAIIAATSVPKSERPVETVEPLATALGLPIETRWNTHDVQTLASTMLEDKSYNGKQVLICWRHDALQKLAHAFGATDAPAWSNTLYDRIWLLTKSADKAELTALRQIIDNNVIRVEKE